MNVDTAAGGGTDNLVAAFDVAYRDSSRPVF